MTIHIISIWYSPKHESANGQSLTQFIKSNKSKSHLIVTSNIYTVRNNGSIVQEQCLALMNDGALKHFEELCNDGAMSMKKFHLAKSACQGECSNSVYIPLNLFDAVEEKQIHDCLASLLQCAVDAGIMSSDDYTISIEMKEKSKFRCVIRFRESAKRSENKKLQKACRFVLTWIRFNYWTIAELDETNVYALYSQY